MFSPMMGSSMMGFQTGSCDAEFRGFFWGERIQTEDWGTLLKLALEKLLEGLSAVSTTSCLHSCSALSWPNEEDEEDKDDDVKEGEEER